MEESQIHDYTDPYPNIPSFVIHPNGGGKVCTRSKVDTDTFIGPDVTVLRSMIYKKSHVDGLCLIEDSQISETKVNARRSESVIPSKIRCSRLANARINSYVSLETTFLVNTDVESSNGKINIKYFYVGHSYLGGNITLTGEPKILSEAPMRWCPNIICSHIEGNLTFDFLHSVKIHSIIIKPENSPLRATPNRIALTKLLDSLPDVDTKPKRVSWGYEPDRILLENAELISKLSSEQL